MKLKASRKSKSRRTPLQVFLSLSARLFVYYVIYLAIWRCPPGSQLDSTSPRLCHTLDSSVNYLSPYFSPHYERYAAPYLELAHPYVEKAQSLYHISVSPVVNKGSDLYFSHAHPLVIKNADRVKAHVQPLLERINSQYLALITPYTDKVSHFTSHYVVPFSQSTYQQFSKLNAKVITPIYKTVAVYTNKVIASAQVHIFPKVYKYVSLVSRTIYNYVRLVFRWIITFITPKISAVYESSVEPQVNKIIDRIFQDTEVNVPTTVAPEKTLVSQPTYSATHLGSASEGETVASSASGSATPSESTGTLESQTISSNANSTPSSSIGTNSASTTATLGSTESSTIEPSSNDRAADLVYEKVNAKSSPNEFNKDVRAQAPLDKKRARRRASSISSELSNWKKVVNKTTKDAFDTFQTDITKLKETLIVGSNPKFTKLLQELQKAQKAGLNQLTKLVKDMERTLALYNDKEIDLEDIDFYWTPSSVQSIFKEHAEKVRNAALAVREYSQHFAELALNKTEEVRSATIDVLDEFSEVALQEIGRKMVADNNDDSSVPSSNQRNPKWSDWKEFHLLKEHLVQTRQDLIEFDIPMEDINIVLRQAQETANILAKEAAQYLSSLKARADDILIAQIRMERERNQYKEEPEDASFGEDVEVYEELEDSIEETNPQD